MYNFHSLHFLLALKMSSYSSQPPFGCLPVVKDTELISAVRFQYHLPETTLVNQFRGEDSRNPDLEFGRSSFDVRHRFSTSLAWNLPFGPGQRWLNGNGVLPAIFGDIELQSVVTLESGFPFTVALLPEIDNSNTGRSTLGFGANDRPNLAGDPVLDDPTPEMWFHTAAFSMPPFGTFGNAGRNILDGPGYQNVNLGILKHVSVSESADLQLRFESFNLFNRSNFNLPDAFLGSPTFGQIVSARNPRQCQFGLKLIF